MRIGIIGYGRMGKEVERISLDEGHEVTWILDEEENKNGVGLNGHDIQRVDVCIEFSVPEAAVDNIVSVLKLGGRIVSGTTGWFKDLHTVERIARDHPTSALIYGSNFSIGANLFLMLGERAAELFGSFPELFDGAIHEMHHREKVDHPSGTALTLAQLVKANIPGKQSIATVQKPGAVDADALQISSLRIGRMPGLHTLIFDSASDTMEITHRARDRSGFARGALLAANWIQELRGIHRFRDRLSMIVERKK